jgi:type I restriction-modification system DNA methylase subunit
MALSLNKPKLDNLASVIWKSAERLRGKFKSYEYQSVILPIIVIRRLECVLIDWRTTKSAEVLKNRPKLTEKELAKLVKEALADADETLSVEWTHRHYVQDDEYIPHGEDIEAFLKREIAKPIIRWEETKKAGKTILGYEILPNKYFYRYQPPAPAKDLLAEFWKLEKEAEKMLKGLAR